MIVVLGRPNVGKSTLVNRILRRRAAVVDARPGVTRDRREFTAEWSGREFLLVDTGGWELRPDEELHYGIKDQSETAIGGADVVIFVADAKSEVTEDDRAVARLLLRSQIPYVFVANKVDSSKQELDVNHLWNLGLGPAHPVSALHGRGTGDFLDALIAKIPKVDRNEIEPAVASLAIIGRPNVGKSTLLNKLAGKQRVLVSESPGTTRDPINLVVDLDGEPFEIIDTAGIKRRSKIQDDIEYYAVLRARDVLRQADVALLVIDSLEGATHQEQRLAEEIAASGSGVVVLLNKWDAVDQESRELTEDSVGDRLAFVSWAPVLRISAQTGARTHRLPKAIRTVLRNRRIRIPTADLNRQIRKWQEAHPPPVRKGKRARIIYAVQAEREPPLLVLFVRGGDLSPDYLRFLENRLRDTYELSGAPIRLVTRRRHRKFESAR